MNLDKHYRYADIDLSLTINDDDGNPINITSFNDIRVIVYHKYSRIIIDKFAKTPAAGWESMTYPVPSDGTIYFSVQSAESSDAQTGIYAYDIQTRQTDANYDDNIYDEIESGDFFILGASKFEDI